MTDKMIPVPRELLEELRDCANDCFNYDSALAYSRSTRVNFYEALMEQCDTLLHEAEAALPECCGNPAQCWEPCGELGKSAEHASPADEELRRDAELGRIAMRFVDRAGDVHPGIDDADRICAEFYAAMSEVLDRAAIAAEKREGEC